MQIISKMRFMERNSENNHVIGFNNPQNKLQRKIIKERYPLSIVKKYYDFCEKHSVVTRNIFIEEGSAIIMVIYDKEGNQYRVYFDSDESIERLDKWRWAIQLSPSNGIPYVRNDNVGFFHRYLLELPFPADPKQTQVVDHLDKNPLNNRRYNLRIVDNSLNQKNKSIQRNNTSGIAGINYSENIDAWVCRASDFNKKRHTRTFSVNKYGFEEAKELAIEQREKFKREFGYL